MCRNPNQLHSLSTSLGHTLYLDKLCWTRCNLNQLDEGLICIHHVDSGEPKTTSTPGKRGSARARVLASVCFLPRRAAVAMAACTSSLSISRPAVARRAAPLRARAAPRRAVRAPAARGAGRSSSASRAQLCARLLRHARETGVGGTLRSCQGREVARGVHDWCPERREAPARARWRATARWLPWQPGARTAPRLLRAARCACPDAPLEGSPAGACGNRGWRMPPRGAAARRGQINGERGYRVARRI